MGDAATARGAPLSGSPGGRVRDGALLVAALLVVVPVHWAAVTEGFRVDLFAPDGPCHFFDAYADSLTEGRLDVDPYHIGSEGFVLDDRTYGYFGMAPALLRIPLNALLPSLWGLWARAFLVAAAAVTVVAAHVLVCSFRLAAGERRSRLGAVTHVAFLLLVGVGSTTAFLPSRPHVFHEAMALGGAFSLAGYAALARYLIRPSWWGVGATLALCLAAVHARFVAGAGVALAILLVAALGAAEGLFGGAGRLARRAGLPVRAETRRHALALGVGVALVISTHCAQNWAKFSLPISLPFERQIPALLAPWAEAHLQKFHPFNALSSAWNFFVPWGLRLSLEAPLVRPVPLGELAVLPASTIGYRAPIASLASTSPALLALSALGVRSLWRRWRSGRAGSPALPCVLGSIAPAAAALSYFVLVQRYAHDLLPLLVTTAAIPVAALRGAPGRRHRWWLGALLAATAWSAVAWNQIGLSHRAWARSVRILPVRSPLLIPVYERALARSPDDAVHLAELGFLKELEGNAAAGFALVERALAIDPSCESALDFLEVRGWRADLARGTNLLRRWVEANPHRPRGRLALARALLAGGRGEEALEHLSEAARQAPDDERVRRALDEAARRSGD